MKKRLLILLLTLTAVLGLSGLSACKEDEKLSPSKGLEYTLSNDASYYILSDVGEFTGYNISIPATHNNLPVKEIGKNAFLDCHFSTITIPNSVTIINKGAFEGCFRLKTITLPSQLSTLENNLFDGCVRLKSITLPNTITSIGEATFNDCISLTSITIPDSVTSIEESAFDGCISLTSITVTWENEYYASQDGILYNKDKTQFIHIPQAVTGVIAIPNSVTFIGQHTFYGCDSLTSIIIPDSVTSIGQKAFSYCTNLTSVTIGSDVQFIEQGAFSGCNSLTRVYYEGTAQKWKKIDIQSDNDCLTSATRYYRETQPRIASINIGGT